MGQKNIVQIVVFVLCFFLVPIVVVNEGPIKIPTLDGRENGSEAALSPMKDVFPRSTVYVVPIQPVRDRAFSRGFSLLVGLFSSCHRSGLSPHAPRGCASRHLLALCLGLLPQALFLQHWRHSCSYSLSQSYIISESACLFQDEY